MAAAQVHLGGLQVLRTGEQIMERKISTWMSMELTSDSESDMCPGSCCPYRILTYVSSSMNRQNQLEVSHRGVDGICTNVHRLPSLILGRPATPLERFCSEHHRHEKIAFMMRDGREEAQSLHGLGRKHTRDMNGVAPGNCTQHEHVPANEIASKSSPQSKPRSPRFRTHLEVDASNSLQEEEGDGDQHLEALRIAARIK